MRINPRQPPMLLTRTLCFSLLAASASVGAPRAQALQIQIQSPFKYIHTSTAKSMSKALNSAGLAPEDSRKLPERAPQPHEEKILQAIREMYSCNPKEVSGDGLWVGGCVLLIGTPPL